MPRSISSTETERTGVIVFPFDGERIIGGHAVLFVGYNDARGCLEFKNSWSVSWGDNGYGYLPYAFVTSGRADDFWSISDAEFYARRFDPGASELA